MNPRLPYRQEDTLTSGFLGVAQRITNDHLAMLLKLAFCVADVQPMRFISGHLCYHDARLSMVTAVPWNLP